MKFKVTYTFDGKPYAVIEEAAGAGAIWARQRRLSARIVTVEPVAASPAPAVVPELPEAARRRKATILAAAAVGAAVGAVAAFADLLIAAFIGLECLCAAWVLQPGVEEVSARANRYRYVPPQARSGGAFPGIFFACVGGFFGSLYLRQKGLEGANAVVVSVIFSAISAGLCAIICAQLVRRTSDSK